MATIGRDPNKTRSELAAGESGAQAVQGAASTLQRQYESNQQNANQMASTYGGLAQQGEELKERKRSNLAQEEEHSRSNQMHEAQVSDQQDIERADRGLQSKGQSRADRLRQEMEQGRLKAQMDKSIEVQGPDRGTISQTPERVANDKSKAAAAEMSASAKFLNASRLAREAELSGNKEAAAAEVKNLNEYVKSAAKLYDTFKSPRGADDAQWKSVAAMTSGVPDPALQQEIQSRTMGPRLSQFLQAQVDQRALSFIAQRGDMPDGHQVDLASPMMVALTQTASGIQDYLRTADQLSQGFVSVASGINSLDARNRFVRKLAAQKLLQTSANPAGQQQDPIPSQGGPSAQPTIRAQAERAGVDRGTIDRAESGAPVENPGGGPPLLRGRDDILQSAERARSKRTDRVRDYGFSGGGKR